MTEEINKITHFVGSVSFSMTKEIEESFTRESEPERARERENVCGLRQCERER